MDTRTIFIIVFGLLTVLFLMMTVVLSINMNSNRKRIAKLEEKKSSLGGPSYSVQFFDLASSQVACDVKIRDTLIVGKTGCDFNIIDDPNISDKHFQVTRTEGGQYTLKDLNSVSGTFYNHAPVYGTVVISNNGLITVGNQNYMIILKEFANGGSAAR